jgi:flagellar biosynthesis GTPase FlhF
MPKSSKNRKQTYSGILDSPFKKTEPDSSSTMDQPASSKPERDFISDESAVPSSEEKSQMDQHLEEHIQEFVETNAQTASPSTSEENPTSQDYDIRMTLPLTKYQTALLDQLELQIKTTRDRSYRKQRLTKNAIIRALIDLLDENQHAIDWNNIKDEPELKQRMRKGWLS